MSSDFPNPPNGLALPKNFGNVVRLFPLPNLVLFPGVVQALHIFEPRYREMANDALASDELITMAMEDVQNTDSDDPRPDLLSTVCIGKIVSHSVLDDGRYNLLLVGAARARIIEEIVTDHPYRMAKVEVIGDSFNYAPDDVDSLNQQILQLFRKLTDRRGVGEVESLSRLMKGDLPLGQISDLVCYACGADPMQQLRVLEEAEVCRRAEILIQILQRLLEDPPSGGPSGGEFPPEFSVN